MREISRESVTIEWKPPLDDGGLQLTKYAIEKQDDGRWVKVNMLPFLTQLSDQTTKSFPTAKNATQ